jgi:hypothetical protein
MPRPAITGRSWANTRVALPMAFVPVIASGGAIAADFASTVAGITAPNSAPTADTASTSITARRALPRRRRGMASAATE